MFPEPHIPKFEGDFFDSHTTSHGTSLPVSFDWRDKIAFNPVQHQGFHCGACWAFASTAAVESQFHIKKRTTSMNLSKQELVDCTEHSFNPKYRNHGCNYGWDTDAYTYIQYEGIMEDQYYPYTGTFNETCMRDHIKAQHRYKIDGHATLRFNSTDEVIMRTLIEKGPLTVNIVGTSELFRHYQ